MLPKFLYTHPGVNQKTSIVSGINWVGRNQAENAWKGESAEETTLHYTIQLFINSCFTNYDWDF